MRFNLRITVVLVFSLFFLSSVFPVLAYLYPNLETYNPDVESYYDTSLGMDVTPDGRYVAFTAEPGGDVYIYDRTEDEYTSITGGLNQDAKPFKDPTISNNGCVIAFTVSGQALPSDTNFGTDIYVYDCNTATTTIASTNVSGDVGAGDAYFPDISGDGDLLVFKSSSDLDGDLSLDYNDDIFIKDLSDLSIIEITSGSNSQSTRGPRISNDGDYVIFSSGASNLTSSDLNSNEDVFVYDISTSDIMRITDGDGPSLRGSISSNGDYITFESDATDLILSDTNAKRDIFFFDLANEITTNGFSDLADQNNFERIPDTPETDDYSLNSAVSSDGRYVAFYSTADNIYLYGDDESSGSLYIYDRTDDALQLVGPKKGTTFSSDDYFIKTIEIVFNGLDPELFFDGDLSFGRYYDLLIEGGPGDPEFGDVPSEEGGSNYINAYRGSHDVTDPALLYLGSLIDFEDYHQFSYDALGDDDFDSDDEDGVVMPPYTYNGMPVKFTVTVVGEGYLNAWFDANADNDWDDIGEKIADDLVVATGTYVVVGTTTAENTDTYARFRVSSASGISYDTQDVDDGEIEDYMITLGNDYDGDFVPDYQEYLDGSNFDSDLYPTSSTDFLDTDSDLIPDFYEIWVDLTDENDANNFLDTDEGGTPDYIELAYLFNSTGSLGPTDINDGDDDDSDCDGYSDYDELLAETDLEDGVCSGPTAPTVTTDGSSSITQTSATLLGAISIGSADTVGFEYGTTLSYGATTTENGSFSAGDEDPAEFSASITDLTCDTTYHFRAYGSNSGVFGYGNDSTFDTLDCSPPAEQDLLIEFSSITFTDSESIGNSSISIIVAGTTTSASLSFDLNDIGSGTATSSDYSISPTTVTIPAGNYNSTTTIVLNNVHITDDLDDEMDETIIISLSNGDTGISFADVDGGGSTTTQTTITITDNDEPDSDPVDIPSGSRGNSGTGGPTSVEFPTLTINEITLPTTTDLGFILGPAVEVGPEYYQTDLLLHWTFDDVSGTFVPDNSGREKNGELLSGAKIATDTPSLSGGALLIDSSGQKTASIADDIFPEEITSLSVSYWVKYTDLSNFSGDKTTSDIYYQKLINYQSGLGWHAYGLRLGINRAIDGIASIIGFGPQTDVSCLSQIFVDTQTGVPSVDEWHHIVFSWDNSTREGVMYIDGQETLRSRINAGSTNDTCTFEASTAIDFIAGDGSLGFRGLIDDVRVYGRVISIDDINNIQRDNAPRNTGGEDNTGNPISTTTQGVDDGGGIDLGVTIDKAVEVVSEGVKTVIDLTRDSANRISEVAEDVLDDIEPIFNNDFGQATVVAVATSTIAVGLGLSILPAIVSQIVSVGDIGFSLARWFGSILSFIGLTKKYKAPWGTVFDSVTKQPIDPALVTIYDSFGNEIQSRITDLDGRYGFFVPPGEYSISTKKTNYAFPSEKRGGDIVYGNLYFGEKFVVTDPTVPVALNIPMDNLAFDWNQMAKEQIGNVIFFSKVMRIGSNLLDVLSVLGIALTLFSYLTTKSVLDLYLLIAVFVIGILKIFVFKTKQTGKIRLEDGSPASFAFVRAYSPSTGVELGKTVCDAEGRFYLLIPKGEYMLKISPFDLINNSHSIKTFNTSSMYSNKGYINSNLLIG